jgi:hypothetical protein
VTSHELANELLALPDLPVINSEDAEIDSVEQDGEEIVIYSEDDDDEEEAETSEVATEDH